MKKVYIEITNSCNLDCKFCHNTNREKEEISVSNFEYIINQVKKYSGLICLHVKGEPLFHSKLGDILNILEKNKLKTNITTNGTLLNLRKDVLNNSKVVRQINISLHSSIENENIVVPVYMNRVYDIVKELENAGIIISYRLWNLKEYKENDKNNEIIKFLEEKYGISNLKELLMEHEWIKLKENVFINQDKEFIWPNMNTEILNEEGRCLALKEQFAILVNGDVIPCCIDSEGEIKLGNIFEKSLDEILNSKRSLDIINNFQNNKICEELCKRCGFLKRLEDKRK